MPAIDTSTDLHLFSMEPSMTRVVTSMPSQRREFLTRQTRRPNTTFRAAPTEHSQSSTVRNTTAPADISLTLADQAMTQLMRFRQFKSDWDGNGAAKPLDNSLKDARHFIRLLAPESIVPRPALHADGHTVLLLNNGDIYVELEFLGENAIGFYARQGGQEWCDEFSMDAGALPEGLSQLGFAIER